MAADTLWEWAGYLMWMCRGGAVVVLFGWRGKRKSKVQRDARVVAAHTTVEDHGSWVL